MTGRCLSFFLLEQKATPLLQVDYRILVDHYFSNIVEALENFFIEILEFTASEFGRDYFNLDQ